MIDIDPENPPRVLIEWDDAKGDGGEWEELEDALKRTVRPAETGLFLIRADDRQLTVVGSWGPEDKDTGEPVVIPRGCVKAIWLLEKTKRLDE